MKTITLFFLCIILGGCCYQRHEGYQSSFRPPTDEVLPYSQLKPTTKWYGIPFICWYEKKGAPYDLEIEFISTNKTPTSIVLNKVTLTNPEGETHQLLETAVTLNSIYRRGFDRSAVWKYNKAPIKFIDGEPCWVEVEYVIGETSFSKQWRMRDLFSKQWRMRDLFSKRTKSLMSVIKDSP